MAKTAERKFKYLMPESYLAYIRNSAGNRTFRNFYVRDEKGKLIDVLGQGNFSCAVYVCSILTAFHLIKESHFTTERTVEDIIESGWKKVRLSALKPGDVLVWEKKRGGSGREVPHIGFFLGDGRAISNNFAVGEVRRHHYTYKGKRAITAAYRPDWNKAHVKG